MENSCTKLEQSIGELNHQINKQMEALNALLKNLKEQELTYRRFIEEKGLVEAYERFAKTEVGIPERCQHTEERRLPGNVLR